MLDQRSTPYRIRTGWDHLRFARGQLSVSRAFANLSEKYVFIPSIKFTFFSLLAYPKLDPHRPLIGFSIFAVVHVAVVFLWVLPHRGLVASPSAASSTIRSPRVLVLSLWFVNFTNLRTLRGGLIRNFRPRSPKLRQHG